MAGCRCRVISSHSVVSKGHSPASRGRGRPHNESHFQKLKGISGYLHWYGTSKRYDEARVNHHHFRFIFGESVLLLPTLCLFAVSEQEELVAGRPISSSRTVEPEASRQAAARAHSSMKRSSKHLCFCLVCTSQLIICQRMLSVGYSDCKVVNGCEQETARLSEIAVDATKTTIVKHAQNIARYYWKWVKKKRTQGDRSWQGR